MCTNPNGVTEGTGGADVAALLAAAPGLAVIAALMEVDPLTPSECDRLVMLEAWEKQHAWLAATALPTMAAVAGPRPVDGDDFVREDVRAALHLSQQVAQDRIDVARALHTTLPATLRAINEGRISYRR